MITQIPLHIVCDDLRDFCAGDGIFGMEIAVSTFAISVYNAVVSQFHDRICILRVDLRVVIKTAAANIREIKNIAQSIRKILTGAGAFWIEIRNIAQRIGLQILD